MGREDGPGARGRDFELVDIADYRLPLFDEPRSQRTGAYQHDHARAQATKIAELDGFVFVTPEYNRSIPASLKNAIDFVYHEWTTRPPAASDTAARSAAPAPSTTCGTSPRRSS
ncbi:NADPH-dependent FMN reductase [Streptomyces sp. 4N124]|uniref:NADPH-dependent FMN reductase n=1 Tax=Streptomyces sp. 4N124 TaxID=3457420 RepID=UPI003FD6418D